MINFGSSLRVGALKGDMEITGKEKQVPPVFHRERGMQAVTTTLRGVKLPYCQANNSKYSFVKVITFPLPRVMKNYAK